MGHQRSRIATIAADGSSKPTYLTDFDSFAVHPDWSPDDQRLVYNTYDFGNMLAEGLVSDLLTMDVDGSHVAVLTGAADVGMERVGNARWDPDGSRIWVATLADGVRRMGWVDPATGALTTLPVEGGAVDPQP